MCELGVFCQYLNLDLYDLSRVMGKQDFVYAKTKVQISCAVTAQLISAFVFTTQIVQFILYIYKISRFYLCSVGV